MAGDWIKMRTDLQTHPKVVRIVSALNADKCPQSVQILSDKFRVIGALHAVWSLFDAHSVDGILEGYTPEVLDSAIGFPGFTLALASVGWVSVDAQALVLPRFEDHNGQSAKRRAQDADRKQAVRKMSAPEADKKRTREEKRREEVKATPVVPKGDSTAVVVDAYHHALPKCQGAHVMNDKRLKRIKAAIKLARQVCASQGWEYSDGASFWTAYFAECATDPWMRGEVPNPKSSTWKQNLDVLLAEDRFAGIMDKAIASMRGAE